MAKSEKAQMKNTQRLLSQRLLLITLLAIGLRIGWGIFVLNTNPQLADTGDYVLYSVGARDFAENGNFTNSIFLVRPPLFPLFVWLLGDNDTWVLFANAVIGGLIAPFTYVLGKQLGLKERWSLLAAFIVAVDILSVRYSAFLAPEAIANLTTLLVFNCLLAAVHVESKWRSAGWAVMAALILLVSAYTRPAIYLIWTGLSLWLLVAYRRKWLSWVLFAALSVGGIQAWTYHNGQVFGNQTFSTVSAFTLTFYRAAAVENLATDMTIDEVYMDITRRVEEKLGNDPSLADSGTRFGYHAASPEIEEALVDVSMEIFREYPVVYVATIPVGFLRMYDLAPRVPPLERIFDWQHYPTYIWNWLLVLLPVYGLWRAIREKNWLLFWTVFLAAGYFTVGTLLVKSAGMEGRERTMLTPFQAVATIYAVSWLYQGWQKKRQKKAKTEFPSTSTNH